MTPWRLGLRGFKAWSEKCEGKARKASETWTESHFKKISLGTKIPFDIRRTGVKSSIFVEKMTPGFGSVKT
jgi:hypothetical protein